MSTPHSTRPGDPSQGGQAAGEVAGHDYPPARPAGQGEQDKAGFGPDFASGAWPAFMAGGIGAIVVGILLLAWPKATLAIVAILIGASLVVAGLLRLIDGFTAHDASGGRRVTRVLIGLLAIIVGLYCIRHYHVTIAALAILVGLFWILHGIADIAAGLFAGAFPGRGLTVVAGVLSLFAGLIVLFWPAISLTVLIAVIGIWLLVYGLLMAITAFSLRRSASRSGALASA
ncbi:MAG: HdeD family acid-resistance protein [Streptosporangiaceae bacterium]